MEKKLWYSSQTVWLGLALSAIPLLQALQALPLNETTQQVVSAILGLLVVLNRFYSQGEQLTFKKEQQEESY